VLQCDTNIVKDSASSIFRLSDVGGSNALQNSGIVLQHYMTSQSRRPWFESRAACWFNCIYLERNQCALLFMWIHKTSRNTRKFFYKLYQCDW